MKKHVLYTAPVIRESALYKRACILKVHLTLGSRRYSSAVTDATGSYLPRTHSDRSVSVVAPATITRAAVDRHMRAQVRRVRCVEHAYLRAIIDDDLLAAVKKMRALTALARSAWPPAGHSVMVSTFDLRSGRGAFDSWPSCFNASRTRWHTQRRRKGTEQEARLSQRDRATRCVSWNLVNCCTTARKIPFEKGRNIWMTLKVIQGHRNCRY